ncbi:MAG: enoyl-CoA hydratase-related protein, partial [Bryobacteraceae bacterium]
MDGSIGTLTFNNPERHNAMSLDMWRAARAVLAQFEQEAAVRVIVLTGAGGNAFVSGADISKFDSERDTVDAVLEY